MDDNNNVVPETDENTVPQGQEVEQAAPAGAPEENPAM